jgi:hypothetical protein
VSAQCVGIKEKTVKAKKNRKTQPGEVLGISNPEGPKLPHPPSDGSTARGIEVRGEPKRHWGDEDIPQSDGATGIDMGGAGSGPQVAPEHPRPKVEDEI